MRLGIIFESLPQVKQESGMVTTAISWERESQREPISLA